MMWENLPPKKLYCQDLSNFSQSYLYWRSTFYTIYSLIEISPLLLTMIGEGGLVLIRLHYLKQVYIY